MASIHDQWAGKSVRVAIPHEVAFDYEAFVRVQQSVLDRMGMAACCSDIDIRWDVLGASKMQPDFQINDAGEIVD
ncbi:MAG: hypothetical protein H0W01_14670 [Pseudonocardiales bacterium]|nr:hypothetical protein [Pseudonocardiales bacterium]